LAGVLAVNHAVRNKAHALGDAAWLDELPGLVAALEDEWRITVGRPYRDATEAFVAEATLADGTPAAVKLLLPRDGSAARSEITTLRLTDGRGCVRLLREDAGRSALLLERLGPSLHDLAVPLARRREVLCSVAEQVWRPAPDCGLPTGADKARLLADYLTRTWAELDRPCSERAVAHALRCAEHRVAAHDPERAVLVHGDVHEWNALRADGGYKLVDPDGLLAEPEYDMGALMREDPRDWLEGGAHDLTHRLAARTGLDATAIWEWGVLERVSTGLLLTAIGMQPIGREMLAVADLVAE
jgi:streptomycin 6-kinase